MTDLSRDAPWLRLHPDWRPTRLAYVSSAIQTGPFGSQLHTEDYVDAGVPLINPSHIRDGALRPSPEDSVSEGTAHRLSRHRMRAGDVVFGRRGELGRCAVVGHEHQGWLCGTGSMVVRPTFAVVDPDYLQLACSLVGAREWLSLQSVGSTMENLNASILGRLPMPHPPIATQRRIVAGLRVRAATMDALIAKKERLIELLQEKRRALITQAVTKGLDLNVPMKDACGPWLPAVPAHWEVRPLGSALSFISYGFTNPMPVTAEGPYLLTANDVGDGVVSYGSARHTDAAEVRKLTRKCRPARGDILVTKDGTLGRVAVHDGSEACVNQSVAVLTCNGKVASTDFVQNALRAEAYQARMLFEAGGTTIKHIYITRMVKMPIAFPPKEEQERLCGYLSSVRGRFDSALQRCTRGIALLREYRQALITAAVTGQIDVSSDSMHDDVPLPSPAPSPSP